MEAGGYAGKLIAMILIRQVADTIDIPIIDTDGVDDGCDVAATFMLSAEAIQVRIRFAVSKESNAYQNFRDKTLKAKNTDTVISASVVGHPARVVKNRSTTSHAHTEKDSLAGRKTAEDIEVSDTGALRSAVVDGDVVTNSIIAGQIASLTRKKETCEEILKDLYYGVQEVILEEARRWLD